MANIKKVTSVTVFSTGEGKRVSGTYSEMTESGDLVDSNVRFNFIALDEKWRTGDCYDGRILYGCNNNGVHNM